MKPVQSGADIVIFVEDPGAANYVAVLPPVLAAKGLNVALVAAGTAEGYLREHGTKTVSARPFGSAESIMEAYQPRMVVVGTSENTDTLGLGLVDAARRVSLPSLGVVDCGSNAEHRFHREGDPLSGAPDWLAVPDEGTRTAFVALGFRGDRVAVCGHPHYDYVLMRGQEMAAEDVSALRSRVFPQAGKRRIVIFSAEVSTGLHPAQYRRSAEYTLLGRGTSDGRTEIVMEEFLDAAAAISPRPYLVLRLHPKNGRHDFPEHQKEFDLVSHGGSPLDLLAGADLVVGMTTMLLFEAALLQRATLAVVPRPYEVRWQPDALTGITEVVTTRAALRTALPRLLSDGRGPAVSPPVPAGAAARLASLVQRIVGGPKGGERD